MSSHYAGPMQPKRNTRNDPHTLTMILLRYGFAKNMPETVIVKRPVRNRPFYFFIVHFCMLSLRFDIDVSRNRWKLWRGGSG